MSDLKTRDQIEKKYKWDIEDMYVSNEKWSEDLAASITLSEEFKAFSGTLASSSDNLLKALICKDNMWKLLEKAFVFARMKKDEDNLDDTYSAMCDRANVAISQISANTSFFVPELLESEQSKIEGFIEENKDLKVYEFALMDIFREKDHVLSKEEEALMANLSQLFPATNDIFSILNNGDMTFGKVKDETGADVTLTHGNYIKFMESKNREVRSDAFEAMYKAYKNLINTIATTYNYNTKTDVVTARIRKYPSALEASLSSDNIKKEVYTNLIEQVNESLPALHKYMKTRKRLLKVDELKMHDVYVPLISLPKVDIPFEEGVDIMVNSLAPMGEEYVEAVKTGVNSRWIDIYENKNKTSGAYSFGSYDSMPYIMLNYTDTLKDVFTLVHEMGHSMHSYYTRKTQPFVYGGHSIFTAEVASTVNENLLLSYLVNNANDKEMEKYLLNLHIEEFRTTLFRQTMFAEFEMMTHEIIEEGGVLTAESMSEIYYNLNKKYFGPALSEDEYIKYEWARIPHFYRAFYVYKYATGFSAATALSHKILNEGAAARDAYIDFLKSGECDYPIELLKIAGIDMGSPEPVKEAMVVFKDLVDRFDELTR